MATEDENLKEKLTSSLSQLQAEAGIFERMMYKNKNQHRRCSYFHHLLKVRRDLRHLQSAKLEELIGSCFEVIIGKKPKQKVHLLESLKRRKCEGGRYTFLERLVGAARLLSEMVEPMIKAASDISILLARSFFMGFSLTILALLARLRVLAQQILLDVVSLHNKVSSLSQNKQTVKITQGGIEVYREYFPSNDKFTILECEWKADKFVLHERTQSVEVGRENNVLGETVSSTTPVVQYQTIESLLGDDESDSNPSMTNLEQKTEDQIKSDENDILSSLLKVEDEAKVGDKSNDSDINAITNNKNYVGDNRLFAVSTVSQSMKKVAFVSVRKSQSTSSGGLLPAKESEHKINGGGDKEKEDPFFNLLSGGIVKNNLF